ncbi:MAG: helix-turn-helix domain-containing protein [Puniceicoccales bacterium]|jgi:transcriptional regulator with XRE-family HTH domain|nr:helix-turn-helix domain-containing protein [Puniceicoccales bacterium]
MNENIGIYFSEARQAKGLSIEDIAEFLHIKSEYIQAIEAGTFDFNLPDIYKRGFYKSYADFLGLNIEEMMAKCPIKPFETLESSQKRREMIAQVAKKTQEVNHDNIKTSFDDDPNRPSTPLPSSFPMRHIFVLKVMGIVLAAILFLALMLYPLITNFSSKPKPSVATEDLRELIQKRIILRANGDVKLMIRNEEDKSKIFSGTLNKGGEKIIAYKKPIQIYFDHGEALVIEMDNGEYLHPDSGRGGLQIK